MKYTAPIRRGFGLFVERGLREHVQEMIRNCTMPHLPRDRKITQKEAGELLAAVSWIEQEAARETVEEGTEAPAQDEVAGTDGGVPPDGPVAEVPAPEQDVASYATGLEPPHPPPDGWAG